MSPAPRAQDQYWARNCAAVHSSLRERSVMVAAKFFDDIYYDNAYYAKVGLLSQRLRCLGTHDSVRGLFHRWAAFRQPR